MECTGKTFGLLQGGKTATLKFGLLDYFFLSFSPLGVVLIFTKRKQKSSRVQRKTIKDGGALNIYVLFATGKKMG